MKWIHALLLAGCVFAGGYAHAQAEDLFAKTHQGAKEAKVASDWYAKLPVWVASRTSRNDFIKTWLMLDEQFKRSPVPQKFEIRDANRNQFNAYFMVKDGINTGNMEPEWKATKSSKWVAWGSWPARFIVSSYPLETNPDVKDLVGFAAWLFSQKENDLANRVLAIVHEKDRDLAPAVEGYLIEKHAWKDAGTLVKWNLWDAEFQRERSILIPASMEAARKSAREKAAEAAFKQLLANRGDYKGRPPRRNTPKKMLIMVEWDVKQFKLEFAASDFIKDPKREVIIEEILGSIKDDQDRIRDGMDALSKKEKDPNKQKEFTQRLMEMEGLLTMDPENYQLRSQIGNEWYYFAQPDEYGNDCKNPQAAHKAIGHYKKLLEYFPQNLAYLIATGKCYQALQDSKHAAPYYERVIELDGQGSFGKMAEALKRNMETKDEIREKERARDKIGER